MTVSLCLGLLLLLARLSSGKLKEGECEGEHVVFVLQARGLTLLCVVVCVKFLTRFVDGLESSDMSDIDVLEKKFRGVCGQAKKKENRFVCGERER